MSNFLSGEKIYLRPLEPCDSQYHKWFNDPQVCAGNSHCVYPMTQSNTLDYIDSLDNRTDILALAIVYRENGAHIGNISLQNIHPIYRSAELAVIIWYPKLHNTGIGTEACQLIIQHGFNALNLHRISCATFRTNIGMQFLAGKVGMEQEGIRKQAAYKNGEWVDVIEYGMVRT